MAVAATGGGGRGQGKATKRFVQVFGAAAPAKHSPHLAERMHGDGAARVVRVQNRFFVVVPDVQQRPPPPPSGSHVTQLSCKIMMMMMIIYVCRPGQIGDCLDNFW